MSCSISLQMIYKNAIIFYQKNMYKYYSCPKIGSNYYFDRSHLS